LAVDDLINQTVLFPERQIRQTPDQLSLAYEDCLVHGADGQRLHGWYLPAAGPQRPVVMISHGNAGNVGEFLPWAQLIVKLGYDAVLYDYPGYGESQGKPDVKTLVPSGEAFLDWIAGRWPERKVVLMGLSLGTLVSIALAGRCPQRVCGAVLEGSLIPEMELKNKFGVLGSAVAWAVCQQIPEELRSDKQIANVACPTLFVHSEGDEIATLHGARKLYDLARCEKQFWSVPQSAHLDIVFTRGQEYARRVEQFLNRCL